jgi:uncharacterized protein (TIGR00730 family)
MEQQDTAEANRQAILSSPSYRLAEYDFDFLKRDDIRHVRMTLELLKTETLLRDNNVKATVVVFGSARIVPQDVAELRLQEAVQAAEKKPRDATLKRAVDRAERVLAKCRFYDEARGFGRLVSTVCQIEGRNDFVIATGGGPGIMEAANRGAAECGAPSIGFNIDLPLEQLPNRYITPSLALRFHYFALRKMHFLLRAKALVAFPGGYGTLDEVFESLNLVQTGKIQPIPIVLVGAAHWRRVLDFDYLMEQGFITQRERELACVVETGAQAARVVLDFHRAAAAAT